MEKILGREKRGVTKRYFKLLLKARVPVLWILAYIASAIVVTEIGISATEYTSELFSGNVDFMGVVVPFLLVTLLSLAIGNISGILQGVAEQRVSHNARRMIWKKVVRLPMSYYSENSANDLITRVTSDVTSVSTLVMRVIVVFFTTGYQSLALLKKIGDYDTKLMLAIIAALPLEFLIAFIIGKLNFGLSDVQNKKFAEMTRGVRESTSNYLLVKSRGTEDQEFESGAKKMKEVYRYSVLGQWFGFSGIMYAVAGMIQFAIIMLVGRGFYADGTLTLAQWIAYYGFSTQLFNALSAYCNYFTTYKSTQGATNRVAQIMELEEENVDAGRTVESLSGDITLSDVHFAYPNGKQVFEGLNLTIPAGRVVAVVGPSGSGKTTLLNIIERMYPIQSGSIAFGEDVVEEVSLRSFRSNITYLTQECTMFSGTIRENLLFGVKREVEEEELRKVCKDVDLLTFIDENGGFDMQVGEAGSRLSGGQKQRVALARALLMQVNYLFMDEATTAMDVRSKDLVWNAIRANMAGGSVLMVAHDRQTVQEADYIIVLEDGKLTAQGEPAQVAQKNAYFAQLTGKEEA